VATGEELREAMRRFPSGVAVLTVAAERHRLGVTVASLVSLSLEPPLVGVSIGVQTQPHELVREAGRFAVSLLAGGQEAVAQHFARAVPPIAHWTGVATRASEWPEPLVDGALAWLRCRVAAEHPAGDHTLFVGEVLDVERGAAAPALVFVEGRYAAV
jgi:flavin reductase (DIM6/NTAB) family NADH-FMN oxidoreductase RutF